MDIVWDRVITSSRHFLLVTVLTVNVLKRLGYFCLCKMCTVNYAGKGNYSSENEGKV